ncbi:hypothetical protein COV25_04455 [candidate division WWE3 bacterium CG10_big_fil_rev_8_21_14_0_10_35_32]|nr:MAG: hypothetical protein COV25_04455 [candidate division WWE3 bacterium CG10_big_fil_rev_8_21_14_0_10_35_32]
MQTVSITPKWQIHIPISVREQLGLKKPTQAKVYVEDNFIIIKPEQSKILQIGAKYKGRKSLKPIDITHIRDYIDYSEI